MAKIKQGKRLQKGEFKIFGALFAIAYGNQIRAVRRNSDDAYISLAKIDIARRGLRGDNQNSLHKVTSTSIVLNESRTRTDTKKPPGGGRSLVVSFVRGRECFAHFIADCAPWDDRG